MYQILGTFNDTSECTNFEWKALTISKSSENLSQTTFILIKMGSIDN